MTNQKALTQVPLGAIKNFIDKNFKEVEFSPEAIAFFENSFLGDIDKLIEIIAVKDGNPDDISKWLVEEYDIKLEMKGDYVIATVLFFSLEFLKKATFKVIEGKLEDYAGGRHENCMMYKFYNGKRKAETPFYQLNLDSKKWEIFVSETELDKYILDDEKSWDEYVKKDERVHLTLPMVNYKEEVDLSDIFNGATLVKKDSLVEYKVEEVKTVTVLNLGLDKIEVKQVAEMGMTRGISFTKDVVINDDFFVYIFYNKKLAFASNMLKEDFISGEELKELQG